MALSLASGRDGSARCPGRGTLVLGGGTALAVGAVLIGELGRVWKRGSAPLPRESDSLIIAAEEALAETAEVARAGYRDVSTRENALFNLLSSFAATFVVARTITTCSAAARRWGRFAACASASGTYITSCQAS